MNKISLLAQVLLCFRGCRSSIDGRRMGAACTQRPKPAPFVSHTHPTLCENPNRHLAQPGSAYVNVKSRGIADMSWCFTSMINICWLICWPWVVLVLEGWESQSVTHERYHTGGKRSSGGNMFIENGVRVCEHAWAGNTAAEKDYWVGEGLKQGRRVGGKDALHCRARQHTHSLSESSAEAVHRFYVTQQRPIPHSTRGSRRYLVTSQKFNDWPHWSVRACSHRRNQDDDLVKAKKWFPALHHLSVIWSLHNPLPYFQPWNILSEFKWMILFQHSQRTVPPYRACLFQFYNKPTRARFRFWVRA